MKIKVVKMIKLKNNLRFLIKKINFKSKMIINKYKNTYVYQIFCMYNHISNKMYK